MADKKISALTTATTPLAGTEVLPIVQSGVTKKVSIENVLTSAQPSGTANGVVYLNGSKIASSGTALTFNGTNFGVGTTLPEEKIDVFGQIQARPVTNTTGNADWFVIGSIEEASNFGVGVGIEVENSGANAYGMNFGVKPAGSGIVTRMRLTTAGNAVLTDGNFVVGTAGKGIDFSADGQAAGMTSELLDDYEEGTWTPTVGGDATYTIQEGYYVKVGNLVYVQCQLLLNVLGTGNTTTISGLPFQAFTSANSSRGTGSIWYCGNLATNVTNIVPGVTPAGTTITFGGFTAAGATMSVPLTVFGNGTRVDFSMTYRSN